MVATKQSLSRNVNKTQKSLPASPRKKCEVTGKLAKKFKLHTCEQKKKGGRKNKDLDDEKMEWNEAFLNRSDVTYMNQGRKTTYIGKFNGGRKCKQKRYLLWTIRNLLDIINGIRGKEVDTEKFSDVFETDLFFI